jgi:hypothetical protein
VIAAGAPKHGAFMADESMQALPGLQVIKYDLPFYKEYMKEVTKIVKHLNKEGKVVLVTVYLTLYLLIFLNGLVHLLFKEHSIINSRDIQI